MEVISPVQTEWASPIVRVPKKDGSPRHCVDWSKLDSMMNQESYPVLHIEECIDSLRVVPLFSKLGKIADTRKSILQEKIKIEPSLNLIMIFPSLLGCPLYWRMWQRLFNEE